MKEILAVVWMNRTNAVKRALIGAGVAGFTAVKVLGRGRPVEDPDLLRDQKEHYLAMAGDDVLDAEETERQVASYLEGTRLFPRRLFSVLAHDEDVPRIVEAITAAGRAGTSVDDGAIFVLPVLDAVRVRTGETGEAAIW